MQNMLGYNGYFNIEKDLKVAKSGNSRGKQNLYCFSVLFFLMKFAKQLALRIIPEWSDHYLSYKEMKKDIKAVYTRTEGT